MNATDRLEHYKKGGGIHLNPAHAGETRARLHAKPGKKLNVSALESDKAKAEKEGDTHRERQDQFAINFRGKKK